MSDQNKPLSAPRIAIKFGNASSTQNSTFSSTKKHSHSSRHGGTTLGKRYRARALNDVSGSESSDGEDGRDEEVQGYGRHEAITSIGEDFVPQKKIDRLQNRRWKEEARERNGDRGRGRGNGRERDRHGDRDRDEKGEKGFVEKEVDLADRDKAIKWGLSLPTKQSKQESADGTLQLQQQLKQEQNHKADDNDQTSTKSPKTEDSEALAALLSNGTSPKPTTIRTIPAPQPQSETKAYQTALSNCGEDAKLEDYDDMPVDDFGAALLRGMGWNGEHTERGKSVVRRANHQGLGAKSLDAKEDLGAWGQGGGKKRRPRMDEFNREQGKRKEERDRRRDGRERSPDRGDRRDGGYRERNGERKWRQDRV
jgi:hypothetical protein